MKELFYALSLDLTGYEQLDRPLSDSYYEQVQKAAGTKLADLLGVYRSKVQGQGEDREGLIRATIWADPETQALCQAIVNLWYTAILKWDTLTWIAPPSAYYDSLLWKAIDAHPPAVSGGYHGYWRYPPEN